ncbi:hypothetical protein KIL84_020194 [Mauremys mutica]|uniref:Uncharacterized protein n=1 Tax=Mauremys mutica TaxID=74926 RepID=A0A9D3XY66_9SAUR|nr:hypothetical protein KIL84_020194 [Mauremys mutica]
MSLKCSHCLGLKPRARKNRDIKLKLLLMEKSLHPGLDPGLDSSPEKPECSPRLSADPHSPCPVKRKSSVIMQMTRNRLPSPHTLRLSSPEHHPWLGQQL